MSTCSNCSAAIPSDHRFCGMCGAPLVAGAAAPVSAVAGSTAAAGPPAGPGVVRRYRGPIVLGSIGTVLFVAGAGVATAILSAFQLDAAPAILVDLFQPLIEDQVGGTVADGVADIAGTTDGATEASAWMIAGFVAAALVAAFGGLLMLIAGAWGANRAMTKRRAGTVAIPPAPAQPVYAQPTFQPPVAPTVAVPAHQPPPAEAPTVVIPSSEAPTAIVSPRQPAPPTGRRLG